MVPSLIKLYLGLTIDTTVGSEVIRWTTTFAGGSYNDTENRYEFVPGNFIDDDDNTPTSFPDLSDGYYNLYINGVLQQGGLSAIMDIGGVETLVINVDELDAEDLATPIVIEFVTHVASSTPASDVVDAPKI